ncbi:MAG: hypothetical protein ACMZI0_15795 [Symbiopectobacterium sp.]|uniref:hypothetical protein n=1 Tax=Symbiopectobacterium sp. TaxID=2952789 RepID=UPI0039E75946
MAAWSGSNLEVTQNIDKNVAFNMKVVFLNNHLINTPLKPLSTVTHFGFFE